MELTREQAIKFHKLMWMDMQDMFGDNPSRWMREAFKADWCKEHIGSEIENNCFLCEYTSQKTGRHDGSNCEYCPIDWKSKRTLVFCENGEVTWGNSPISEILALEERKVDDE